jgi:lysophospholipase L1-like esterase
MSAWIRVLIGSAMVLITTSGRGAELSVRNGDRIVFLGDSITQAGAGPGGYVTGFKQAIAEKHKDKQVEVIGAGISGNRVPDLEKRLERDVLSKKPTVVVIYIGINDVWHSQQGRGTPLDQFEAGLRRIVTAIQKTGARVVLCTPSVIGEKTDGSNPLDKMLEEYSSVSRQVATESKSQLLDLRKAFQEHLKQHNPQNLEKGVLTTDGVHLNAAGNQFVADQMLAAFHGPATQASGTSNRVLRHVVLFKFKADVTPTQVQEVIDEFRKLADKIETVQGFEWGTDVSPEKLADGFTHCFFVTFADEKGRDAYLPHPAHQEFVNIAKPRLDKVLVVDYWTQR